MSPELFVVEALLIAVVVAGAYRLGLRKGRFQGVKMVGSSLESYLWQKRLRKRVVAKMSAAPTTVPGTSELQ